MKISPPIQTALRRLPLPVVAGVASAAYRRLLGKHPDIFSRLREHAAKRYLFAPTDLAFEFAIAPSNGTVRVARPGRILRADVRIAAPLFLLLALAEGSVDGDAEFFGRQVSVDGDMAAAVALRNALENGRLDFVKEFSPASGPLRGPVAGLLIGLRRKVIAPGHQTWS